MPRLTTLWEVDVRLRDPAQNSYRSPFGVDVAATTRTQTANGQRVPRPRMANAYPDREWPTRAQTANSCPCCFIVDTPADQL
ncbi:uncharacterized protein Nmag_1038 [Natrialba magadii ATCC 43099]|uniref:Uncharacterized protein n=1 Tax=Natrialba magadii (strain ATCC 43099 / DSM 3394 / CCM 3739 / CIP 104546 / IAM 13178 / JCM 8861 / NBRC 102185 / NCIMB 2190 / MS3) TaxID=547559 RepID=D3SRB7_NATMM|nr:uncharacterized protein Nmag_1038 [Natrialba magadii ATCC 43099]